MQMNKDTKTKLYLFLGILFLLLAFWLVSNFKGRFGQDTVGVITTESRQETKSNGDLEYMEREIDGGDDASDESNGRLLRAVPKNSTSATIIVHIVGAVKVPGVYELPANSRMNDALRAARGFVSNADRNSVNLAEKISDGQKIVFPFIASAKEDNTFTVAKTSEGNSTTQNAESKSEKRTSRTKSKKSQNTDIVNINTASEEELMTIVGVGKVLARSIVNYRATHGTFTAVEELLQVRGIGQKKFQKLQNQVTIR